MTEDERIANALREWLRYETWTLREGLLMLTGIDPHHAGCFEFSPDCTSFQAVPPEGELVRFPTWCRIGSPPRLEVDAGGVPHVAGWMFSFDDSMRLCELLEHWHRTPSHDGLTRASPAHFIAWSERIDKAPFWLNAVRCAGYMPASMGLFTAVQSKPYPAPAVDLKPTKKPGDDWTPADYAELLRQYESLTTGKDAMKGESARVELGKAWSYAPNSIKPFLTTARKQRNSTT